MKNKTINTFIKDRFKKLGIKLVAIDRPGVGLSTNWENRTMLDFATDVQQVLDYLGVNEFSVQGMSGGGPFALAVAHAFPNRVRRVGIIGTLV